MKQRRFKELSGVHADAMGLGQDFLSRHGGPGADELRKGESDNGRRGWWELDAADGYKLRCDWFRIGEEEQLTYSEIPP